MKYASNGVIRGKTAGLTKKQELLNEWLHRFDFLAFLPTSILKLYKKEFGLVLLDKEEKILY